MVQTDAKGETGATMERMVEEEGLVPERSEWFRSRATMSTLRALILLGLRRSGRATQQMCCLSQHQVCDRPGLVHEHRRLLPTVSTCLGSSWSGE